MELGHQTLAAGNGQQDTFMDLNEIHETDDTPRRIPEEYMRVKHLNFNHDLPRGRPSVRSPSARSREESTRSEAPMDEDPGRGTQQQHHIAPGWPSVSTCGRDRNRNNGVRKQSRKGEHYGRDLEDVRFLILK